MILLKQIKKKLKKMMKIINGFKMMINNKVIMMITI